MCPLYEKMKKRILNESCTVKELIEILSKYPHDMKIITTWESTLRPIERNNIYLSKDEKFVYLDADYNSYKEDFAKDPHEKE